MMRAISATTSPVSAETMKIVNTRLVAKVEQLASARGVTLAQIALAWLHHRSKVHGLSVVPIPGTRKRPCLSARAVHLTHIAQRSPVRARYAGHSPNSAKRKHQITRHPWRTSPPPLHPSLSFRYT